MGPAAIFFVIAWVRAGTKLYLAVPSARYLPRDLPYLLGAIEPIPAAHQLGQPVDE
jgi:hypothetical protein